MPALPPSADDLLRELSAREILPPPQAEALAAAERAAPFSIHYELRTLLYLGVVALSGGLGALLYQHHQRLGPAVILSLMVLVMAAAGAYAVRHRPPFTWGVAPRTSVGADYALLLACLLLLGIETYAQAQYNLFGTRYGLATALPAVLFAPLAYRYDHRGVLALALTALATWLGLTVAPLDVVDDFNLLHASVRGAAIGLGLAFGVAAFEAEWNGHKAHFAPTYLTLGANLMGAALAAVLLSDSSFDAGQLLAIPAVAGISWGLYAFARRTRSWWFLVLAVVWAYLLITYLYVRFLIATDLSDEAVFMAALYFLASVLVIIWFFRNIKQLLPPGPQS